MSNITSHMSATDWMLAAIIVLCVLCLVASFIGHMINTEWNDADKPTYRTADGKTIAKQIKSLRRNRP